MNAQLTRYDRRMQEIMNRREAAPLYATAARRRVLVVVHVLMTASTVVAWGNPYVTLGLLLPWCVATGGINAATRGLLELRRRALDERQRAERSEVLARAHRITTVLLLAGVVAVGLYMNAGGDLKAIAFRVFLGVLVAHWLMPMWVAGLRAQDEPDDE